MRRRQWAEHLHQANLLSLTASATNVALTTNGWTNFFRGLANDGVQAPAMAKYLTGTLGLKKICVIQDNSDYGVGLAGYVISRPSGPSRT